MILLAKARRRRINPRKGMYTPYGEPEDEYGIEGIGGPDSAD